MQVQVQVQVENIVQLLWVGSLLPTSAESIASSNDDVISVLNVECTGALLDRDSFHIAEYNAVRMK